MQNFLFWQSDDCEDSQFSWLASCRCCWIFFVLLYISIVWALLSKVIIVSLSFSVSIRVCLHSYSWLTSPTLCCLVLSLLFSSSLSQILSVSCSPMSQCWCLCSLVPVISGGAITREMTVLFFSLSFSPSRCPLFSSFSSSRFPHTTPCSTYLLGPCERCKDGFLLSTCVHTRVHIDMYVSWGTAGKYLYGEQKRYACVCICA